MPSPGFRRTVIRAVRWLNSSIGWSNCTAWASAGAAILPILDDFERAIADKSEDPKAIKEGVQMIFNKFVKTLEGLGVKKIETNDKDFDVDFHEAIAMVPGMGDDKKGKIIDCVQTGYTMNDKVIRHAKVAVGQ